MDFELANSFSEAQMDWMIIMMQVDNQFAHHQFPQPQSPHTPLDSTAPMTASFYKSTPFSYKEFKPKMVQEMREMVFFMAALQPVQINPESIKAPKRRNVKISNDPQSVAARLRREKISQRIRILQRLVPGGTKMDTASMLDEAVQYLKFLKNQVNLMQGAGVGQRAPAAGFIKSTKFWI